MTSFRFIVLAAASLLSACNTPPAMPMDAAATGSMAMSGPMEKMDAQMKAMHEMHARMMNAGTPEERRKLMAEHMKTMQDAMKTMSAGMADMKGMKDMPGDMGAHHQMMARQMEMMQSMIKMMMDQMPPPAAR